MHLQYTYMLKKKTLKLVLLEKIESAKVGSVESGRLLTPTYSHGSSPHVYPSYNAIRWIPCQSEIA